ncbi:UDP-2,3-diacylglucosamine diphosphatase [Gallaecimonas sp. GXIMD4217]|uniref:UDP-2,3-diacylglucosamine diphosphatase n=1 Tax=Gallaecimonas sp. GXIMD4217 TaxID=3131927 RepID=UPI00311AE03F
MSHFNYRTVFLSDLHLGSRDCQADYLLSLLKHIKPESLYLLGDVVDLWAMGRKGLWPHSHSQVLFELERLARQGTRVVYVPGNHDAALRRFCGFGLDRFEMHRRCEHQLLDGRTLLLTHGDEFDAAVCLGAFEAQIGNLGYDLLMWLNRSCQFLRRRLGLPYWSLATFIKKRVGKAQAAIDRYRHAALRAARQAGCDGIVLGHIHQPQLSQEDGLLYLNTGDWVESCSLVAEGLDGRLQLLHWSEQQQVLACTDRERIIRAA